MSEEIRGNLEKNPKEKVNGKKVPDYREEWIKSANKYNKKKAHPFCNGIQMDTHHLISGKALKDISEDLQEALILKGYNINALKNLVGLPKTYKGACYLGIQLHRTGHTFKNNEFGEVKSSHYHNEVMRFIQSIEGDIMQCNGTTEIEESKRDIHVNHMDDISSQLLEMILDFILPLTKISHHFDKSSEVYIGCAGKDRIGQLSKNNLTPCKEDHYDTLDSTKRYTPDTTIKFKGDWVPEATI